MPPSAAGAGRSLEELVALVKEHFPGVRAEYVERDALGPSPRTLSIDKGRTLLAYEPQTSLEDRVARDVAWYRRLVAGQTASAAGLPAVA